MGAARRAVALDLDNSVLTLARIKSPSQTQSRTLESRVNTQASHPQIVEQPLFGAADLQFPPPLCGPHVVFHKRLARQLLQRVGKQPLDGVEHDIRLYQIVRQTQLLNGAVDREPPLMHPNQPLLFRVEELEVELAGLDKIDSETVRLGAGPHASAEKALYRPGEGGLELRGRDGRCRCESTMFLFLGGANQVVLA